MEGWIDPIALIEEEFPLPVRSLFVPAIKTAYAVVEDHFSQIDFLDWPVGHDTLGVIRRVAVEFYITKLIDQKRLPLKYRIAPNAIDNCRHLEILSERCIATVSQVTSPKAVPRSAVFRDYLSLSNQPRLNFPDYDYETGDNKKYYIILTHGYTGREPSFICLGAPAPKVKKWVAKIDLLKEPYREESDVEIITSEPLVALKKYAQEVLKHGS